jgi:hypothetical protein
MLQCAKAGSKGQVQGLSRPFTPSAGDNGQGPRPLAGSRRAVLNVPVRMRGPSAVTWTDMVAWSVIAERPEPAGARVRVRIVASGDTGWW